MSVGFVIATELFPSRLRSLITPFNFAMYALSSSLLSPIAYFARDWRILHIVTSAVAVLPLIYYPWVESVKQLRSILLFKCSICEWSTSSHMQIDIQNSTDDCSVLSSIQINPRHHFAKFKGTTRTSSQQFIYKNFSKKIRTLKNQCGIHGKSLEDHFSGVKIILVGLPDSQAVDSYFCIN